MVLISSPDYQKAMELLANLVAEIKEDADIGCYYERVAKNLLKEVRAIERLLKPATDER